MNRALKTALIGGVILCAFLAGGWFLTRPGDTASPITLPGTTVTAPTSADFTSVIPADVTWQLTNQIAVPVSPTAGPTRTSPEGIRSGFAHTPAGAMMAAANWAAAEVAISQQTSDAALIDQRMMHWPGYEQMQAEAVNHPTHPGLILQIAGFEFLAYDGDHATILVAQHLTAPTGTGSNGYCPWINLVWSAGDWYVVPNISGLLEVGIPIPWPLAAGWTKFAGVA